jgi:hypothetical protein
MPGNGWSVANAPANQNGRERANTIKKNVRGDLLRDAMVFKESSSITNACSGGVPPNFCPGGKIVFKIVFKDPRAHRTHRYTPSVASVFADGLTLVRAAPARSGGTM